ncbi:hypothetical protein V1477_009256 [Vespula maculifrons]|uniref:Uncharacterized protein n=1 Tax=Vespula maculifrons TaxID=7453 RepID=A0ABD2C9A1_VESMC
MKHSRKIQPSQNKRIRMCFKKMRRKLIVINWSTMNKNKENFIEDRQQHKDFDSRSLSGTDTRIKRLVETIRNPHLRKNVALATSECPILN